MSTSDPNAGPAGPTGTSVPADAVTVSGHAEVVRVATDPVRFSNAASRFLQIPNGLDGAEHDRFRALVDRYFTPGALAEFEPACRRVACELTGAICPGEVFDAVGGLGGRFAVRAQVAWLGWTPALEEPLLEWLKDKFESMRSGDPALAEDAARRFDALVLPLLEERRDSDGSRDVTDRLLHDTSAGRPLTDAEVVSILRNWTGGDLASIAQCVGVIVHDLAAHASIDRRLRDESSDPRFDEGLEELLRRNDPFTSSRRVATCPVEAGGSRVRTGQRVTLDWRAANRDPGVFRDPDAFDPHGNSAHNLVYGVGPHVCPGRPLVRMELRELVRALHSDFRRLVLAGAPVEERPPMGGFRSVPVRALA